MDQTDLELEQRVWSRLGGGNGMEESDLRGVMLRAEESANEFRRMALNAGNARREKLVQLHHRCADHANAIRGMMVLAGENPGSRSTYTAPREGTARSLALAYRRSREQSGDYAALTDHAEYGDVFRDMLDDERQTMRQVLELIGQNAEK